MAPPKQASYFGLYKCVSIGYTQGAMKDVGLRIRVQRDLREQFLEVCRKQDKPAAQVLREFMRTYIAKSALVQQPTKTGLSIVDPDSAKRNSDSYGKVRRKEVVRTS